MMRRLLLFPLTATLMLIAAACGGGDEGSSTSIEAKAGDVTARLDIPAGSLPAGVAPEDVSITAVEGPSEKRFAVFRLEPDGMVPLKPLTITLTVDLAEGEGLSLAVMDADGNPVDGAAEIESLARTADDGPLDLRVRVDHFSEWIIGRLDSVFKLFRTDIEPLDDQLVGTTFSVRARVTRNPQLHHESTYSGRLFVGTNDTVWRWELLGSWKAAGPVSPDEALNPGTSPVGARYPRPFTFYPKERSGVVVEQEFTCERAGDFAIAFALSGWMLMNLIHKSDGLDVLWTMAIAPQMASVSWSARCVAPATPERTSTPTPTSAELAAGGLPPGALAVASDGTATVVDAGNIVVLFLDGMYFHAAA